MHGHFHGLLRTTRALAIPCRPTALLLIAIFSPLLWLGLSGGVIGILLSAIIVSWFFKYAFALLDRTAEGGSEPPVLSYEMIHPLNEQRPLATLAILYLFYLATQWLDSWIGPLGTDILRALLLACVPAIVAVQGISGSFASAANPIRWLELIIRLRGSYLVILAAVGAFCLLAQSVVPSEVATTPLLAVLMPAAYVLRIAILMFGWLALHAFIGVVLFERRHEIGFEPSRSPERLAARRQREEQRDLDLVIDGIFAQWRGGAHGNAWKTVEAHLENSPNRVTALRALFERIALWPDGRLGNLLANELLPGLLDAQRNGEALEVARERLSKDPTFRPARAGVIIRLANLARDAGDRAMARQLLDDFASRFPDDPSRSIAAQLSAELAR